MGSLFAYESKLLADIRGILTFMLHLLASSEDLLAIREKLSSLYPHAVLINCVIYWTILYFNNLLFINMLNILSFLEIMKLIIFYDRSN